MTADYDEHVCEPGERIHVCTEDEWNAEVERQAQRLFGISREEFIRRWQTGEYSWSHDHPEHSKIVHVAMLLGY